MTFHPLSLTATFIQWFCNYAPITFQIKHLTTKMTFLAFTIQISLQLTRLWRFVITYFGLFVEALVLSKYLVYSLSHRWRILEERFISGEPPGLRKAQIWYCRYMIIWQPNKGKSWKSLLCCFSFYFDKTFLITFFCIFRAMLHLRRYLTMYSWRKLEHNSFRSCLSLNQQIQRLAVKVKAKRKLK